MNTFKKIHWVTIAAAVSLFLLIYCCADRAPDEVEITNTDQQVTNIDQQIDAAISKVNSDNPMEGIKLLREIAEKNPQNERTQLQLGIFSMQSEQYDKAIERFNKVVVINSNNKEAYYYLAELYEKTKNNEKAIENYSRYKELIGDTAIANGVEKHIAQLNKQK